jgi:hypothetical protein
LLLMRKYTNVSATFQIFFVPVHGILAEFCKNFIYKNL